MAVFSCGGLAQNQLLNKMARYIELFQMSEHEMVSLMELEETDLYRDSESLKETFRTFVGYALKGTKVKSESEVQATIETLAPLFPSKRSDVRAEKIMCLDDIQSGFSALHASDQTALDKIDSKQGETLADWIRKPNKHLAGITPIDLMTHSHDALNIVASLCCGDSPTPNQIRSISEAIHNTSSETLESKPE